MPIDEKGDIIRLRTVFHNTIQNIAGRVLDISIVNFQEHPKVAMDIINHDLKKQFFTDPPLRAWYRRENL